MNRALLGIAWSTLLAQHPLLEGIRKGMPSGINGGQVALFLLGALVVVGLLVFLNRLPQRIDASRQEEQVDYLGIASDILELSDEERHDVNWIATKLELSQPVSMLLTPANFTYAVQRALIASEDQALRRRLNALCVKLFGVTLPHGKDDSRQDPSRQSTAPRGQG